MTKMKENKPEDNNYGRLRDVCGMWVDLETGAWFIVDKEEEPQFPRQGPTMSKDGSVSEHPGSVKVLFKARTMYLSVLFVYLFFWMNFILLYIIIP